MSDRDEKRRIRHLNARAGFGNTPALPEAAGEKSAAELAHMLFRQKSRTISPVTVPQAEELSAVDIRKLREMSRDERRALQKKNREGVKDLNLAWLNEMIRTPRPLQEKMSLFWHGHFACRVNNLIHSQQLLAVIREYALGNFGDLLIAVSKSAAMLQFLNNQQNRREHPNENFAREVMELFTMGRGHYTEEDVKEGARAFTGWGYDRHGNFRFRQNLHDPGTKTFLGRQGRFTGDDILKILLEQKATAYHIAGKIYRYFVNDIPDEATIRSLGDQFYQHNYDIARLMQTIFESNWFYDHRNTGNRIKSPVELLVGMQRQIPVHFRNGNVQLFFQRVLDQVLFYPPNVAGWPGGRTWIDSSTLMFRLRLPQIIYYAGTTDVRPKDMPDEMTEQDSMTDGFVQRYARKVHATADWDRYIRSFESIPAAGLPEAVADALLVNGAGRSTALLKEFSGNAPREDLIRTLSVALMSTPEYQLS